jgi:branched-chain amino acid transport system permease protein
MFRFLSEILDRFGSFLESIGFDLLVFKIPILSLQASLDGILLGVLFALIAYGMALQWGVMNIINIAQGELVIMGGYVAYFMYVIGIHPAFGVIVSPVIMYFVGVGLYKLVINKVVDRDLFISILATFGISILTQQLMNFIFGADVVVAQSNFGTTMLFDNSVTLPNSKIFSALVSVIVAIVLVIYMKKSKLGRAIRATAQNARAAKILGVDTEKVYAATFGINAALCGVAGACIAITFTLHPYVGLPYTVRSFMIVIVAGLGNLPGVAISGMGLGVFEEFADYLLGTEFRIGAVFLLLVLILVYRRFKLSRKREYLK